MSKETFDGLIWSSPAGVCAQVLELAARSDQPTSKHQIEAKAVRHRRAKVVDERYNPPMSVAAAGLVFLGLVLGTTVAVTILS
jgi:hypothetical protein